MTSSPISIYFSCSFHFIIDFLSTFAAAILFAQLSLCPDTVAYLFLLLTAVFRFIFLFPLSVCLSSFLAVSCMVVWNIIFFNRATESRWVLDHVREIANKDVANRKLFVRGLSWETNSDMLLSVSYFPWQFSRWTHGMRVFYFWAWMIFFHTTLESALFITCSFYIPARPELAQEHWKLI